MTTTGTKRLTFEEWQSLLETKGICEVVDGALLMPPGPMGEHPGISDEILATLRPFLRSHGLGIAISAPYDVLIRRDPLRFQLAVADIFGPLLRWMITQWNYISCRLFSNEPSEDTEYKYMAEAPDLPGCRAWRIRWEKRWTTFAV
jgi:hypothetical protein